MLLNCIQGKYYLVPKHSTPCNEQTECYFFSQELAQCQVFDGCPEEGANNFDSGRLPLYMWRYIIANGVSSIFVPKSCAPATEYSSFFSQLDHFAQLLYANRLPVRTQSLLQGSAVLVPRW